MPHAEQQVDGLLGLNVLSRLTVLIDPQLKWVMLWWPRALTSAERERMNMGDAVELPLKERDDGVLQVQARLNDTVDVQLPLDTGSDVTCIPMNVADQLKLEPTGPGRMAESLYDKGREREAPLQQIALGTLKLWWMVVHYSDNPRLINQALGMDVLSRFRVLLDIPNKKLYLKPVAALSPTPADKSAGQTKEP
jgi:predicted aspartyl protease